MIGLIVLVLILIGSPPTVGADVIMRLEATSGSLRQFQDSTSGAPSLGLDLFWMASRHREALPCLLSRPCTRFRAN